MTLLAAIPFVERKDALTLFKGSAACFALGLCSHYKSEYDIKTAGNRACKDLKSIEMMIEEIESKRNTKK